jgi:hypothetical protein
VICDGWMLGGRSSSTWPAVGTALQQRPIRTGDAPVAVQIDAYKAVFFSCRRLRLMDRNVMRASWRRHASIPMPRVAGRSAGAWPLSCSLGQVLCFPWRRGKKGGGSCEVVLAVDQLVRLEMILRGWLSTDPPDDPWNVDALAGCHCRLRHVNLWSVEIALRRGFRRRGPPWRKWCLIWLRLSKSWR